jgi:hypothetical protein
VIVRKQKLFVAIPMDPPSQCLLQEPLLLLEKSSEKSTKVHHHEEAEEDLSLVMVGPPVVLANIPARSFLLGLMMAFSNASSAYLARILILAIFGDNTDPDMVSLFSMVWSSFTSFLIIIGLRFSGAFDRLVVYLLSGDPCECAAANKTSIIIRTIVCHFVLGMLRGICSFWVLTDIWIGIDGYTSKYNAGMLVGVMMLSFIFKTIIIRDIECHFGLGILLGICSAWVAMDILLGKDGHIKYSAGILVGVLMLWSLIFQFCSNKFAPVSSSTLLVMKGDA